MSSFQVNPTLQQTRFSNIRWVSETGSTNADLVNLVSASLDVAKNTALQGSHTAPETVHATISVSEPRPHVLGADFQSAGRGRQGRSWVAPPATSVLMSVAVPLYGLHRIPQSNWSWLTPALSLAVQTSINSLILDAHSGSSTVEGDQGQAVLNGQVMLKWPNDVVVVDSDAPHGYKKLAGILAELIADPDHPWAVVGVGINTNWPEIPEELNSTTTSVNKLCGEDVDRNDFITRILHSLDRDWLALLEAVSSQTPQPTGTDFVDNANEDASQVRVFRERYLEQLLTIGQRVRVETAVGSYEAMAVDIETDGRLKVELDSGEVSSISAADVVHLRPIQQ